MENVFAVDSTHAFWCYSENMGYEYLVEIEKENQLNNAKSIAQQALDIYGNPYGYLEAGEITQDQHDYYWNAGYCEVVEDALNKAGIKHKIYSPIHKDHGSLWY